MNKKGHRLGAIGAMGLTLLVEYKTGTKINVVTIAQNVPAMVAIYYFAFVPDIDAEYSHIRNRIKKVSTMYTKVQKAVEPIPFLDNIFKHRGALLHSIWTLIPFMVLYQLTGLMLFLGCVIGLLSHHFLDMLTPAKLRWLYPLKIKL